MQLTTGMGQVLIIVSTSPRQRSSSALLAFAWCSRGYLTKGNGAFGQLQAALASNHIDYEYRCEEGQRTEKQGCPPCGWPCCELWTKLREFFHEMPFQSSKCLKKANLEPRSACTMPSLLLENSVHALIHFYG